MYFSGSSPVSNLPPLAAGTTNIMFVRGDEQSKAVQEIETNWKVACAQADEDDWGEDDDVNSMLAL